MSEGYADTLSSRYAAYIGFEAEAAQLLVFDTFVVPGLLQTEAYARALFGAATRPNPDEAVDRKIQVRLARQELMRSPCPLNLWAILDESVLYRSMGDRRILHGQLAQLIETCSLPSITGTRRPDHGGLDAFTQSGMAEEFAQRHGRRLCRGETGRRRRPVRDSKDPAGPMLTFTLVAWRDFLTGIRKGDFDRG